MLRAARGGVRAPPLPARARRRHSTAASPSELRRSYTCVGCFAPYRTPRTAAALVPTPIATGALPPGACPERRCCHWAPSLAVPPHPQDCSAAPAPATTDRSLSDPVMIYDSKPVDEYRPLKKQQPVPAPPLNVAVGRGEAWPCLYSPRVGWAMAASRDRAAGAASAVGPPITNNQARPQGSRAASIPTACAFAHLVLASLCAHLLLTWCAAPKVCVCRRPRPSCRRARMRRRRRRTRRGRRRRTRTCEPLFAAAIAAAGTAAAHRLACGSALPVWMVLGS